MKPNPMQESIWERNLASVAQNDPTQADTLRECDRRFRSRAYPIRKTEDGLRDAQCPMEDGGARYLYQGKPAETTRAIAEEWKVKATPGECILLLGFGLGYPVRAILRDMDSTGKLIVVEPDPLLFYSTFLELDLSDVLTDKRVSFIVGLDPGRAIEAIGSQHGWARFSVLPFRLLLHPPTTELRPKYIQLFRQTWVDTLSREFMYRRARSGAGEAVVRHTVANLGALIREPGIQCLFGQLEGAPALQVGAGPSLSHHIDSLKKAKQVALLTCVNAAYPVLRQNGIEPHIVLCLDHEESNFRCFQGDPPHPETFLIADPRIDPRIVNLFEGRVFFISWRTTTETIGKPYPIESVPLAKHGGNAIYQWIQQRIGEKGAVTATGSVAVAGFQILARMGLRPIILIGQDLAFPNARIYADGTMYEDDSLVRDSETTRTVRATDGGLVGTSETLHLYRLLLEHEIKRFGIPVINTSLGGAMIAGAGVQSLDQTLSDLGTLPRPPAESLAALYQGAVREQPISDTHREQIRKEVPRLRQLLEGFAQDARAILDAYRDCGDEVPADQAEKEIQKVIERNRRAFDLLNELLQEPHVRYEETRCHLHVEESPSVRNRMRLESVREVLAAFEKAADLLNEELGMWELE